MFGKYGEMLVVDWGLVKLVDWDDVEVGVCEVVENLFYIEFGSGIVLI